MKSRENNFPCLFNYVSHLLNTSDREALLLCSGIALVTLTLICILSVCAIFLSQMGSPLV